MKSLLLATAMLCACQSATTNPWDSQAAALDVNNGDNLNGDNLNGDNLNGDNLNGDNLNGPNNANVLTGVSYQGVQLNGSRLESTWLDGTMFRGRNGNGSQVAGTDFLQSEFAGSRGDGTTVKVRVLGIYPDAGGPEIWEYDAQYQETNARWYPLCKDSSGNALRVIPVNGRWDYHRGVAGGGGKIAGAEGFTFACKGKGAIAKCVYFGYKPWKTVGGVSLDKHHQACVRLVRADFCGNGTPYTHEGVLINLYDSLGIQLDTEDWFMESEWDQDGARCFNRQNRASINVPCYADRVTSACGKPDHFQQGTLLMNELPTR